MTTARDLKRYRENWQHEVDSASQYHALAESEPSPKLARVYQGLARVEESHVEFWEEKLLREGVRLPPRRPSWRGRLLIWAARRLGAQTVLPTIAAAETAGRNDYATQPETAPTAMAAQERWHARVLQQIAKSSRGSGVEGGFLGRVEGRHRAVGANALRAAVLGANDGLCSNLALVMGVAGAAASPRAILVTGLAGLLAGSLSMALGEWVSVQSARELAARELSTEAAELESNPKAEGDELVLIYEAKGVAADDARRLVDRLLTDKSAALDALAREELGLDPSSLGGSPRVAAAWSFALFAAGALIPLLPFAAFSTTRLAVLVSVALSGAALFAIGAVITLFTGRPALLSGARQLALGLAAAALTFLIGHAVGHGPELAALSL